MKEVKMKIDTKRRALILTWEKFQDHEVIYPYYALQEHGYNVEVCANATKERICGILGAHIVSDYTTNELSVEHMPSYDLLCVPGGVKALEKLVILSEIYLYLDTFYN